MVRVFSTYHYRGQSVHTINDDIITTCLMDNDHMIVAKTNHIIDVFKLPEAINDVNHNDDKNQKQIISFPTVDLVMQMIYSINGNYIATIESRSTRRQNDKHFCRVYANWSALNHASGYNVSIRARIAGKVTPSNTNDCLEVIEIPVKGVPCQVACCQLTGNLAIATNNTIIFYKFVACINESTKYEYIDFKEISFVVDLEFIPTQISITEHCICAMNKEFVYLYKIVESNVTESDDMISANSFTSDISNNGVGVGIGSGGGGIGKKSFACVDFNEKRLDDWTVVISSTNDDEQLIRNSSISEYRPIHIEMDCAFRRLTDRGLDSSSGCNKEYSVKAMLRIRQRDLRDPFRHIFIKPIYLDRHELSDNETMPTVDTDHVLKSTNCDSFLGLAVLVATTNDGYLYQFTNNDKWVTDENSFVATYPFTSPAIGVAMNDYVVQILTDHGIETYTHRIGNKLFSNSYEYNLRDDLFPIETCPRIDEPICLIGLRPFLGVRAMHCTNTQLVLMASSINDGDVVDKDGKDFDSSWTVYNLNLPTPEMLFSDMEELSKSYMKDSPSTYLHLMSEAHMIMRVATEFYSIRKHGEHNAAALVKYESMDCERIYLDSCRMLGDFCIVSSNRDEYCLAFPYYTMGKMTIDGLYDRVRSMNAIQLKPSYIGLIHTLKNMLIKNRHGYENVGRLLTTIRSQKSITFGEELIELFLSDAPNEIAVLTLRSPVFRDYMGTKVCDAIGSKQHRTDVDQLCLILEHVRNNRTKEANEILNCQTENQLFIVLVEYWNLLFDTTHIKKSGKRVTTFSELTEAYLLSSLNPTIQKCISNIFIYLMVDAKVLTIDLFLRLLMDYLAAHVGQNGYVTAQLVLQELLEAYYYNLYVTRQYTGSNSDQSVLLESMTSTSSAAVKGSQNPNQSHSISAQSDSCAIEHFYCDSIQNEAMKILIRIYLGKLKKIQLDAISPPLPSNAIDNTELFKFMKKNLSKLFEHHQNYNENQFGLSGNGISNERHVIPFNQKPILFYEKRSNFLNCMQPICALAGENGGDINLEFLQENLNETQLTVIKFQALLCSGKLTRDILQEIVYFFEANAPLIAMDSFISILLPMANCIDFFIDQYLHLLLPYAKCRIVFDKDWLDFLTRILDKKDCIRKKYSLQNYENTLADILQHIVTTKRLMQVFKILPIKDVDSSERSSSAESEDSCSDIDEEVLFTQYLSMAIDRDRAERLGDMIKTTGHQLYDTYNKNKQFFN